MFLTKQLASGLICTDYSDRTYVVLRNISQANISLDLSTGTLGNATATKSSAVYMSEGRFVLSPDAGDLFFGRVVQPSSTNITEHAVQIDGSWLDAAGLYVYRESGTP